LSNASNALALERTPELAPDALALLESYPWPGNLRELKNVIERAVLLSEGRIDLAHLPIDKLSATWAAAPRHGSLRDRVIEALKRSNHNQTRAAELLGVSRQTLSKWLDRYDVPRPRKPRNSDGQ
jgi:transcriptional regulator of acetoin/glycerol metabolism